MDLKIKLCKFCKVLLVVLVTLTGFSKAIAETSFLNIKLDKFDYFVAFAKLDRLSNTFEAEYHEEVLNKRRRVKRFRFWGLELHDSRLADLEDFLKDRAIRCIELYKLDELTVVDCVAAPRRGSEIRRHGNTNDWISLLVWLPEFNLAKRTCSKADHRRRIMTDKSSFSCATHLGAVRHVFE